MTSTAADSLINRPIKIALTSIAVPIDVLELICKLKHQDETNGNVVKRIILDWLDLKEDKKNLESILSWKNKIIEDKNKKIIELENSQQKEEKENKINEKGKIL